MRSLLIYPNDTVEFIAPASKFNPDILPKVSDLMRKWGLKAKISCPMSESELFCTTGEKERFEVLRQALADPEVKAIWVTWGGYGCCHLLPYLDQLPKPPTPKLLMGFSDTTMLHNFVHKKWHWPSLHCSSAHQTALNKISKESIEALKGLIFGEPYSLALTPMNGHCKNVTAPVVGGNLSIVASTLGTPWQIETEGRFLFLEETGEAAYRVDRMLHQLLQAGLLNGLSGLIFGEFIQRETQVADRQTIQVLNQWAAKLPIPIFSCKVGHAMDNYPIPLNCDAELCSDFLKF
jgi:muramoyltetrapeptide carboxypeptidase